MDALLPIDVRIEEGLADGRRIGCGSLLVGDGEMFVQYSARSWPDDQSILRVAFEVHDVDTGRVLQPRGRGWGGGSLPGEPCAFDGGGWFRGEIGDVARLRCTLDSAVLFDIDVDVVAAANASTRVVATSCHADMTDHDRAMSRRYFPERWPTSQAIPDRVERDGTTQDRTGMTVRVISVEHWGDVLRTVIHIDEATDQATPSGLPVPPPHWWTLEIDGIERWALATGFQSASTGAIGWLVAPVT